jgi:HAD superfamily hydrolase (TIGR01490 family)
MIAALFDIEGTLYTNPMGRGFIQYASSHGRKLWAFAYLVSLMPKYYLSKLHITSRETLNRTAIARMPWLIHGYDLPQAETAFDWVANSFILPSGRESVLRLWDHHRRLGHLLVIASGGLAPCVQRIGAYLDAAGTVGTEVVVRNDRYIGRVGSPVVIGQEKAERTLQLVSQLAVEVDWPASYAYADSIHDQPFLELVGHPVAVYPDKGLDCIARERDWDIIGGGR